MPSIKPSAFEKRVKRRVTARHHDFFAICPPGLEKICAREICALDTDTSEILTIPGGVEFKSKLPGAFLANLCLRSPSKILMRLTSFKAERFSILEKKINAIDWELFLPGNIDLNIRVTCKRSRLYHSDAIAQRCRPIIESKIRPAKKGGSQDLIDKALSSPGRANLDKDHLPPPGPGSISQTIMIRAENDRFEISLDMSGDLLFKRGIKEHVIAAPIRENLAFAILNQTGFRPKDVLIDPMCGSGTFSIEAAMLKSNILPGFFRSFAFEAWPGFKKKSFEYIKKRAAAQFSFQKSPEIFASDIDPKAVDALNSNISKHSFLSCIQASTMDFFDIIPQKLTREKGVVVMNPPYGRRLGKDLDIDSFYHEIGKKLAADFKGWRFGIIFPEKATKQYLGIDCRQMPFFHGGLNLSAGIGSI